MPVCQICKSHATTTLFLAEENGAVTTVLKKSAFQRHLTAFADRGMRLQLSFQGGNEEIQAGLSVD